MCTSWKLIEVSGSKIDKSTYFPYCLYSNHCKMSDWVEWLDKRYYPYQSTTISDNLLLYCTYSIRKDKQSQNLTHQEAYKRYIQEVRDNRNDSKCRREVLKRDWWEWFWFLVWWVETNRHFHHLDLLRVALTFVWKTPIVLEIWVLRILVAKGCREPEEGRGHLPKRETRPEKPCVRLHEMEPKMVRETSEGLESFVTLTYFGNTYIFDS